MKVYDVIIIGGGPSGIITGVTGKKQNPDKKFLMIKEEEKGMVPCGIPYIFHQLDDISKNTMGPKPFVDAGGEVVIDPVTAVDVDSKKVTLKSGQQYGFDKLVFATGSVPLVPKFIKGYNLEGVEYIKKSYNYLEQLKVKTDAAKNIVVVGGGFIGVEVAEQLAENKEKIISLVEREKYCLYRAFSEDVAMKADEVIRDTRINLFTNTSVVEIVGKNGKVTSVKLSNGKEIKADMIIVAVGYQPNSGLAKDAGLEINSVGAIRVDNYLRTSRMDIFAVGDCSQTIGFITGRTDNIMLASTATAEARVLGYNLFKIILKREFSGTLSVFSTEINGLSFASAGAIEQSARDANIDFVTGKFADVDHHPGTLPGTSVLMAKLIVSIGDGAIIGGELYGGKSVGELINVVGMAIQKNVTVYELVSFQIGTHPLLTSAPTKYVLIKAAENAISRLK